MKSSQDLNFSILRLKVLSIISSSLKPQALNSCKGFHLFDGTLNELKTSWLETMVSKYLLGTIPERFTFTAGFVYKCSRRLEIGFPNCIQLGNCCIEKDPKWWTTVLDGIHLYTYMHTVFISLWTPKEQRISDVRSSYTRSSLKIWIWIQLSTIEFQTFKEPLFLVRVVDLSDCLYWRDTKHGENTSTKETLSQLEVVSCGIFVSRHFQATPKWSQCAVRTWYHWGFCRPPNLSADNSIRRLRTPKNDWIFQNV